MELGHQMLLAINDEGAEETSTLQPSLTDPIAQLLQKRTQDTLGITPHIKPGSKPWPDRTYNMHIKFHLKVQQENQFGALLCQIASTFQ